MAIRRIPHRPRRLTELATAMDRTTGAVAIHPTAMLATAIHLMAMATAILLMATAATTVRAIGWPGEWRFIESAGERPHLADVPSSVPSCNLVPVNECGSVSRSYA
jgi:hypothetical protein